MKNNGKSMKTTGNLCKSMEIYETDGNQWNSLVLSSSRRGRRPPVAAWAASDDQTHALTCSQCPRMMLGPSRRLGECIRLPYFRIQRSVTDWTKYLGILTIKKKHNYIVACFFIKGRISQDEWAGTHGVHDLNQFDVNQHDKGNAWDLCARRLVSHDIPPSLAVTQWNICGCGWAFET